MSFGDEVGIELPARSTRAKRPNILMIFSDEHNARMSGFMGDRIVQTPNLDRLASQGVTFDNAYCNSPLCSPSRQSFMAGLYCHRIGMWNNTGAMPEDTVTWAHLLSLAGYETSLVGKMHFNGYQKMYGFDRRPVLEGNNAGESFYSYGVRTSHVWTDPLPYISNVKEHGMQGELRGASEDVPRREPIFQKDLEILDVTCKMLREKGARQDDRPWAICSAFVLPHPPWKARPDILKKYRGKGDLPFNRDGKGRDTCDQYMAKYYGDLTELSDDEIRNAREVYFALIEEFDEYAGRILDCLKESDLDENTVVFYFSDHGEMAGEHGMWAKGHAARGLRPHPAGRPLAGPLQSSAPAWPPRSPWSTSTRPSWRSPVRACPSRWRSTAIRWSRCWRAGPRTSPAARSSANSKARAGTTRGHSSARAGTNTSITTQPTSASTTWRPTRTR